MSEYYIALDQGTSSTRAILYNQEGTKVSDAQQQLQSSYPQSGWVEQDPRQIIESAQWVLRSVVDKSGIDATKICAIGITNQRETTIVWDKKTGEAVYPAIVWQDRRTGDFCKAHKRDINLTEAIHHRTGLVLDPYFSATKLAWILKHVDGVKRKLNNNLLAFGTVDSYLLWHLTYSKHDQPHLTDITNASRTLLFNIQDKQWDHHLLEFFDIPATLLPEVYPSVHTYGNLSKSILGTEIPIVGMIGDQQSAGLGQGCFDQNQAKITYGTGSFLLLNTGTHCVYSQHQLLTTIAYEIAGRVTYALEGSIFIAGSLIKWLKNSLRLFKDESQINELIAQSSEDHEIIFAPTFSGLGAPFWDPHAKGALFGITQDTSIGHIIKAGLEGIGFQTRDLIESLRKDWARVNPETDFIESLKVDGGMTQNDWFLQSLADILNLNIEKSKQVEATAFGAFILAGLGSGLFNTLEDVLPCIQTAQHFKPNVSAHSADHKYQNWLTHIHKIKV